MICLLTDAFIGVRLPFGLCDVGITNLLTDAFIGVRLPFGLCDV